LLTLVPFVVTIPYNLDTIDSNILAPSVIPFNMMLHRTGC